MQPEAEYNEYRILKLGKGEVGGGGRGVLQCAERVDPEPSITGSLTHHSHAP